MCTKGMGTFGMVVVGLLLLGSGAAALTTITNVAGLQAMQSNLSEDYVLGNDIDASNTINWNSGAGFVPVGTLASSFMGSFDGNGFTITGLYINRPSTDYDGRLTGFDILGAVLIDSQLEQAEWVRDFIKANS